MEHYIWMRGGSGKTVQVENIGKILQIYNCYDCSIKRFFVVFTVITVRGFNKLLLNQNVNQRKWSHRNYFTSFALKKLGIFVKMESNFMCFFFVARWRENVYCRVLASRVQSRSFDGIFLRMEWNSSTYAKNNNEQSSDWTFQVKNEKRSPELW